MSRVWTREPGDWPDLRVVVRRLSRRSAACWQWVWCSRRNHRTDSGTFFGLCWRWEWVDETAEPVGEIFSRITLPVACCPDCGRDLEIAPNEPRAIRRPVWPTIYSCRCGFFKGFKDEPEDVEAMVYHEIGRRLLDTENNE
ncbi:MAG: hypothetical protein ABI353_10405 [Isosphaeraceae bacterium]